MAMGLNRLRDRGPAFQAASLVAALVGELALVAPVAWNFRGGVGVLTAATAAAVCLGGALGALGISIAWGGRQRAIASLLGSIFARTGTPLIVGACIYLGGGPLAEAGFIYYLLVFYPVALTVETYLSLPRG